MKILITGYSGFLGSYIKNYLDQKHEVLTLSRSDKSDYKYRLENDIPIFNSNFELVIHSAGKAHSFSNSKKEAQMFYNTNVIGTSNLLIGLCKNPLPKQFVYISSVSVYGVNEGVSINEEHPLSAKDPYGVSKIEAEAIVKKWCDDNNVICTILRPPLIVGANPPGNLGAMIRGIKKGYYFNIGGGNAKKSMVLASDIAKFILIAAEVGGIYNLTDGIHPTFNELSKSIARNFNKSFVPNMSLFMAHILAKFGDILVNAFPINSNKLSKITSNLTFDDSKARIAFGWDPTPVLESFNLYEDA